MEQKWTTMNQKFNKNRFKKMAENGQNLPTIYQKRSKHWPKNALIMDKKIDNKWAKNGPKRTKK